MTNSKNATQKNAKSPIAKIETVTKINLDKFKNALDAMPGVREKKVKDTIYIYPEGFTQLDINSPKGKKFRNSLRNALKRHSNNIFAFSKMGDTEKLLQEIELFSAFYIKNFQKHDFTLNSISQTKNAGKEKDLNLMLQIINEVKGNATTMPKAPAKPKAKK